MRRQALFPGGAHGALVACPPGGTPTWHDDGEGDDERRGRRTTIGDDGRWGRRWRQRPEGGGGRSRQGRRTSGARSRSGHDRDNDRQDGDGGRGTPTRFRHDNNRALSHPLLAHVPRAPIARIRDQGVRVEQRVRRGNATAIVANQRDRDGEGALVVRRWEVGAAHGRG